MSTHNLDREDSLFDNSDKDNELNPKFDFQNNGIGLKDLKEINKLDKEFDNDSNEFPIDVFPSLFKEFSLGCNEALNFPIEYTALGILAAVSTAIGKSAVLKVKNKWNEYASLYVGLVGQSGATKSHPIEIAFEPLVKIDLDELTKFEIKLKEYYELIDTPKSERKGIDIGPKPKLKKAILHNFTSEILHQRLADNDRACGVVSEELETFLEGMNNYSKGDLTSIYLSFWSHKATSIDRVSKEIPLMIHTPYLNIIGGLQPKILSKLFPTNKQDNGFLQRFLFAYPESSEKQPINENEIDENLISRYSEWMNLYIDNNIIQLESNGKPKPKVYTWSIDAKKLFFEWQRMNTDKVNEYPDDIRGEVISKYDNHCVRLCLILQIMFDYHTNEISKEAVKGAIKLCDYFLHTSFKVLDKLQNGNPSLSLPEDKLTLFNLLPEEFTTDDANTKGGHIDMNLKTVQRFLTRNDLFIKLSHGKYKKKHFK
jgi:hypothetical protein